MNNSSQKGFSSTINRRSKAEKIALIIDETTRNKNPNKRWLLDVGTGNGEISEYLGHNFHVVSIDIKDQRACENNFHFIIANEFLPFRSNFFDIVISNHVIEHVQYPKHHINEIYRVIKPEGWLYLATPNRLWPWEVHYKIAFLHYLPAFIFHSILKKTGKYEEDINLKTSWQIKSICKSFKKIESISERICQHPRQYKLNVSDKVNRILSYIPSNCLSILHIFLPTFIFMMQKDLKSRPSILWLTSSYPRFKNDSASVFLQYLAEAIDKTNYDLHILSPDHHKIDYSLHSPSIIQHYFKYFSPRSLQKLAYGSGILPNLKKNSLLFVQVPFFLISQFLACYILVKKIKPAIIHAHWVFPQGAIASVIGKLSNTPVIITAHGGDAFALKGSLLSKIKSWSIKSCTAWTSNTIATASALGSGIQKPNVIPMGIDYKKFSSGTSKVLRADISQQTLILLFVGRLVEKKGVNDLLTAYSLFSDEHKKMTQLWIIGDGTERKTLEHLSQSLNIEHKVTFWGKRPNEQLPDYYAAANIFIAPSITDSSGDTEGQGVILLEAMASGTAIVSTNTGGISEVIDHGKTGILTSPKQPYKLKTAIVQLIENQKLRENLAIQGKQSALYYAWSHIADKFVTLYKKTI